MRKGKRDKRNKKGISPLVSTILLIMIVLILAIIILLWASGFKREAITKTVGNEERTTDYFCSQLSYDPILNDDGSFGFKNTGTIPIYAFKLKLVYTGSGDSNVVDVVDNSGTPISVNGGMTVIIDSPGINAHSEYDKITVLPILLGKKASGGDPEPSPCPEESALVIK
ncbi:MAG: hypothetical protein Q8N99_05250 [Nanoarchaeota archaeon]|nr:hypothetical protein [Nanoarchaeota archaeon]